MSWHRYDAAAPAAVAPGGSARGPQPGHRAPQHRDRPPACFEHLATAVTRRELARRVMQLVLVLVEESPALTNGGR